MGSIEELQNDLDSNSSDDDDDTSRFLPMNTLEEKEPTCDEDGTVRTLKAKLAQYRAENEILQEQVRGLEEQVQDYKNFIKSFFKNYKKADNLSKEHNQMFISEITRQCNEFRDGMIQNVNNELDTCRKALKQVVVDTKPVKSRHGEDTLSAESTGEVLRSSKLLAFVQDVYPDEEFTSEGLTSRYFSFISSFENSECMLYEDVRTFVDRACSGGMKQRNQRMIKRRTVKESRCTKTYYKLADPIDIVEEE